MLSLSVIVLLSSVTWPHAQAFMDNLALGDKLADRAWSWSHPTWTPERGDKLADRALLAWSLQHGLLEDTMNAKPGTRIAKAVGLSSEPTSPCKSPFKVPLVQSPRLRSPLPRTPGAPVDQVAGTRSVNDDVNAAGASAKEGSRYFGRLAPFPGVLPKMVTPNEAASMSIADLTPSKEEAEEAKTQDSENQEQEGATNLSQSADNPLRWRMVLSPKKTKFVPVVVTKPRSSMDTESIVGDIDSRKRPRTSGSQSRVPSN